MRRIGIIMPHYNREWQLLQTLKSINKSEHDNFFVIIIDDGSDSVNVERGYKFSIIINKIEKEEKLKNNWVMSLSQMNTGIKMALELGAEIIITQNCEARHSGDVLMYVEQNITEENYISFGCYSLSQKNTYNPNIEQDIKGIIESNNVCATDGEHDSWYNHPLYRGTGYDFCAAISRNNMIKLNGYDERYATGFCYGDDDYVMRIKRLGLKIDITTDPIVLHQWHGNSMGIRDEHLIVKNRELYINIANNENGFRAKHIFTEDFE